MSHREGGRPLSPRFPGDARRILAAMERDTGRPHAALEADVHRALRDAAATVLGEARAVRTELAGDRFRVQVACTVVREPTADPGEMALAIARGIDPEARPGGRVWATIDDQRLVEAARRALDRALGGALSKVDPPAPREPWEQETEPSGVPVAEVLRLAAARRASATGITLEPEWPGRALGVGLALIGTATMVWVATLMARWGILGG